MYYKGCVLQEEQKYYVVVTKNYNYIKVSKKLTAEIGQEIVFLERDIIKKNQFNKKYISILVASIFLIIVLSPFFTKNNYFKNLNALVAVVSVDINPSMEFQIDKEDNILKVIPLNDAAKDVLSTDLVGKKIYNAIEIVIKNAIAKKYLTDKKYIVLIAKANIKANINKEDDFKEKITKSLQNESDIYSIDIAYIKADKDDLKKSKQEKVSIGRHEVYRQISKEQNAKEVDMNKKSIQEIFDKYSNKINVKYLMKKAEKKSVNKKGQGINNQKINKSNIKNNNDKKDNNKINKRPSNRKDNTRKGVINKEIKNKDLNEKYKNSKKLNNDNKNNKDNKNNRGYNKGNKQNRKPKKAKH